MGGPAPIVFGVLLGGDDLFEGSVPTGRRNDRVRAETGPLPLHENFLAPHRQPERLPRRRQEK
jgi:hypothetical protein